MDVQEACPGFMILEEDITEDDEGIVVDWCLSYSFYLMKRKKYWNEFLCGMFQKFCNPLPTYEPPSNKHPSKISKVNKPPWGYFAIPAILCLYVCIKFM